MKMLQRLSLVALLYSMQFAAAMEIGKYDGGEYCYRLPGSKSRGMYPTALELQSMLDDLEQNGLVKSDALPFEEDNAVIPYLEKKTDDMDFVAVRNCFPILDKLVDGKPLVYFDSASTAQMPQVVLDAIVDYYQSYKSNVGRGMYNFAERATLAFEEVRGKVASFIGAQRREIVFTSGATAGINLVVHVWAQHHIHAGDEIIVSEVEHNANFIPWQQLCQRKGIILKRVPLNDQGVMDIATLQAALSNKTKLVAITHQSNILGTVNDIAAIVDVAHAVGAKVLVDAAQSIAHQRINVEELQCDFLVFSGHKLFGPTGVGVLYLNKNLFDQVVLHNFGGGIVYGLTPEQSNFKSIPYCLEPGTQPIAQVIGLGAAIDFVVQNVNFDQAQQHETELARRLARALQAIPGVQLLTPFPGERQHNNMVTFAFDKLHAYDIAEALNDYSVAIRSGYHCAQLYHEKIGGAASVRVSFSIYNTQAEVDFLIDCLRKILIAA